MLPEMIPEAPPQAKTLKRVLAISRLNGWSVAGFGALGLLLALGLGDGVGGLVSVLVVGAGWMELQGHFQSKRGDPAGVAWLVRSQLFLLSVILIYCASRFGSLDVTALPPDLQTALRQTGLNLDDISPLARAVVLVFYGTVALTAMLYQGGLTVYYWSRARHVTQALQQRSASG